MVRVLIKVWIVVNNRGQVLKQWAFYSQTVFFKIFILRVLIKKKLFLPLRTDFAENYIHFINKKYANYTTISKKRASRDGQEEQGTSLGFVPSTPWCVRACLHHYTKETELGNA